jgi:hypothetical protein
LDILESIEGAVPTSKQNKYMTKKKINQAIKHLNLEIVGNGDGYFYFLDLTTTYQIGESVIVCYLNHLTLDRWVEEATHARNSNIIEGVQK